MPNYYGPLVHKAGNDTSTVIDPRFGDGATPVQPADWGSTGGGTSPAPLTGDTYTAPGIFVPAGALDVWRAARDNSANELVEVTVWGDSVTYGSGDPGRPPSFYSWIRSTKDAATAAGHPDGGHGFMHALDPLTGYVFSDDAPTVVSGYTQWSQAAFAGTGFTNRTNPTVPLVIQGNGTRIRLVFFGSPNDHGKAGYSVDGGPETIIDTRYSEPVGGPYGYQVVLIDGLADGPHTVTITKAGPSDGSPGEFVEVAVEFLRDNGLVFHRNATPGATMSWYFNSVNNAANSRTHGGWGMGLQPLGVRVPNSGTDTLDRAVPGPHPAYRNVKLAIAQLGTNDLGTASISVSIASYAENMAYFARVTRSIGASGIVVAPPFSNLPNPGYTGAPGRAKTVLHGIAATYGLAFADFQEPLGYDLRNWPSRNNATAGPGNSHISAYAYDIEGTWLWENLLSL